MCPLEWGCDATSLGRVLAALAALPPPRLGLRLGLGLGLRLGLGLGLGVGLVHEAHRLRELARVERVPALRGLEPPALARAAILGLGQPVARRLAVLVQLVADRVDRLRVRLGSGLG